MRFGNAGDGTCDARPGNSASRIFFIARRPRDQARQIVIGNGNVPQSANDYSAVQPPSIDRLAPVIDFAASEAR